MNIIDGIKRQFHRDLVSDPVTHGWVLNLYLGGERYPQRVCDYFQSSFAPNAELATQIENHAADEEKHSRLFAHGIELLGQPVVELEMGDIFNETIRSFTPGTFHIAETDSPGQRRWKLANFMAHAHCLEKRVARSFAYHAEACGQASRPAIAGILEVAHRDEERHVHYTRQTVYELLAREEANEVMEAHRRAEAKANLAFSHKQVRAFLQRFPAKCPGHRRALYRVCAMLMEEAARYA
jgi:ribonucleotide reductase beta subunit family protein with ferritin-like domain